MSDGCPQSPRRLGRCTTAHGLGVVVLLWANFQNKRPGLPLGELVMSHGQLSEHLSGSLLVLSRLRGLNKRFVVF